MKVKKDKEGLQDRWKKLLSCKRLNDLKNGCDVKECEDDEDPRNPFQRDCDRITYSYPFRRMQNKTQVIPRPEVDFIHTRLTHSLEVATVGRSMGKLLEKYLLEKNYLNEEWYDKGSLSAIVAAACLAHDIGNPPFGHSGEDSISHYFRFDEGYEKVISSLENHHSNWQFESIMDERLTTSERAKCMDLMRFEGNAMGFRVLTKYNQIGFNLTAATLATFCKYPRQSYIEGDGFFNKQRWRIGTSQKKYGFFHDEVDDFKLIADEVELIQIENQNAWKRHPLTFLMEAADDICYRIIDLEDGFRLGLIPFAEFEENLQNIAKKDKRFIEGDYENYVSRDKKLAFSYLRSRAINYLIHRAMDVFKNNLENILNGEFDDELIKHIEVYSDLEELKEECVRPYIYEWKDVLNIEAAGFEIIGKLLHEFTDASDLCITCDEIAKSTRAKKFNQLIPDEFKNTGDDSMSRYLQIACYVAGMSDSYALDMYHKITGISMK
jgi:dGTPase